MMRPNSGENKRIIIGRDAPAAKPRTENQDSCGGITRRLRERASGKWRWGSCAGGGRLAERSHHFVKRSAAGCVAERRDSRGGSCENLLPQLLCPSDWIQDPASVAMGGDLDEWIAKMRNCELLPEHDLKHLCEYVQELMLEEARCSQCRAQ